MTSARWEPTSSTSSEITAHLVQSSRCSSTRSFSRGGQAVAGAIPEARHRPLALGRGPGVRDVRLQPGGAESFARPVRQRGDAVGREAHQRGDLVRVHPLDLGVPENGLPAVGQRTERLGGQGAVESPRSGIVGNALVFEFLDHIDLDVVRRGSPAAREIADGRIEVGAEGTGGSAARQNTLEDPRVCLADEVIGVDRRRELAGDASSGAVVASPQLGESARIPRSSAFDQLRVRSGELRILTAHPPDPFPGLSCPKWRGRQQWLRSTTRRPQ